MANNDRVADLYFRRILDREVQDACRDRIHWICERVAGPRVLDVGCSQGVAALILAREGHTVVGIDVEEPAIEAAGALIRQEPEHVRRRVSFKVGDAYTAEFEPESFDSVVLGEVLEHLVTPAQLLERIASWVRPGGQVIISVPHGYHPYDDHKRTFYFNSFRDLLEGRLALAELSIVADRYLCAVATRPPAGQPLEAPAPEALHRWERLCSAALEQGERQAHRKGQGLQAKCDELDQRGAEYRASIDQLTTTVEELRERIRAQAGELESLRTTLAETAQRNSEFEAMEGEVQRLRDALETERNRYQDLVADQAASLTEQSRRAERFKQALEAERKQHKRIDTEQKRMKKELGRLQKLNLRLSGKADQLAYYKAELDLLRQGVRFRIGDAFVRSARSPATAPLLPFRLFRLFLDGVSRVRARRRAERSDREGRATEKPGRARSADDAEAEPSPTRVGGPQAGQRETAEQTEPVEAPTFPGIPILTAPYASVPAEQRRRNLRIAAVTDEFSWRAWQFEADLYTFTPQNWLTVLEKRPPEVLLIESTWKGLENSWHYQLRDLGRFPERVGHYALPDIVAWCRRRDIPTVFYNKEDPPNFDVFCDAAKLFDHVFTSDANCIADYRKAVGHERVYALPFAAQPQIHNPVQAGPRAGAVCFAGTWYHHRHFERHDGAERILRPALDFDLHIFDRMAHSDNENYRWPDEYRAALRGGLPYTHMLAAYKYYKVFLNINSVRNSPTMFARRVFELLACGTPVISSYAEGIEKVLGADVVLMSESEAQTRGLLEKVLGDDEYRERLALRGQRRVFSGHTYTHRLETLLATIGLAPTPIGRRQLTVVAPVETHGQLVAAWKNYERQTYDCKQLIICSRKPEVVEAADRVTSRAPGVSVVAGEEMAWGHVLQTAVERIGDGYLAVMNPNDYYGPDYLTDAAHVTLYVTDTAFGKRTLYQADGGGNPHVIEPGLEYRYVNQVCPWTLCLKAREAAQRAVGLAAAQSPSEWWERLTRGESRLYATDRFSYVRQGEGTPAEWNRLAQSGEFAKSEARVMEPALV